MPIRQEDPVAASSLLKAMIEFKVEYFMEIVKEYVPPSLRYVEASPGTATHYKYPRKADFSLDPREYGIHFDRITCLTPAIGTTEAVENSFYQSAMATPESSDVKIGPYAYNHYSKHGYMPGHKNELAEELRN